MEQGSPGPSSAAGGGVAGDGDRVGAFLALASEEAAEGVREVIACKVPLASYGRVQDVFKKFQKAVCDSATAMLRAELADIERASRQREAEARDNLDAAHKSSFEERLASVTAELAEKVTAAEAREATAKEQYNTIVNRRSKSEELLEKAEAKLQQLEEEMDKEEKKGAKLTETNEKLQQRMKVHEEEWGEQLTLALSECTMKSIKVTSVLDEKTRTFKKKQINSTDQVKAELDALKTPGAQLRHLVRLYEKAIKKATGEQVKAKEASEAAIAEAEQAVADMKGHDCDTTRSTQTPKWSDGHTGGAASCTPAR